MNRMSEQRNPLVFNSHEVSLLVRIIRVDVRDFMPLTVEKIKNIRLRIGADNMIWSDEQIISIWHHFSSQNSARACKNIDAVPSLAAIDINNLDGYVKKYYVPPLKLIKMSLMTRGLSKKMASQLIKYPETVESPDLRSLILRGWETDAESPGKWIHQIKQARVFELDVAERLTDYGIDFKTQEHLAVEQIYTHGRAVNTPDFLLIRPILIQGYVINWIDAKDYFMTGIPFLMNKMIKQAERYVEAYGSGAILFHYGFVLGAEIPNVVYLTMQDFPAKK